jgi:membrane protease YdiL (CAAX protease family)
MDTTAEKQVAWKSRDAWFGVLVLIISQFVILFWLRVGARSSPAFSRWWATPFGSGVIYIIQDALWVFVALWFSRVEAVRDFLAPAGLRRGVSVFGWGAAWLAIIVSFIDGYGASKGWTASSRQVHPANYGAFSLTWCYFTLSAVLISPFCEEVVTRGFLYRAFRGRYSPLVTTIIIICFSAYFHWSSVTRSAFTFGCLASLWALLCVVRERTGSLWDCLLCHAVYNLGRIYHSIPAVIVMILLLPFVMRPIWVRRRKTILAAPNRDA